MVFFIVIFYRCVFVIVVYIIVGGKERGGRKGIFISDDIWLSIVLDGLFEENE